MDLASVPTEFPQFGKSLWNIARPAEEVFDLGEKGMGACDCSAGHCGCGGTCGGSGGGPCGGSCGSRRTNVAPPARRAGRIGVRGLWSWLGGASMAHRAYIESSWDRSEHALSVPVDRRRPPNEIVPWDPWLTTTTSTVTVSPPFPWLAAACGWCDGCWPLLTWDLQLAAGMLPISVILDADALLPLLNPGPYQSTHEQIHDTNPHYVESISVTVLRDRSRNGACRAAGTGCQQEKPCRFDTDLSLQSHSTNSFEVLGQPAPVVLPPGGAAIVVLKKDVACGGKVSLGLKRLQLLPPDVVQLEEESESDSLPIGQCEQCYPRC